jgi:hypothetical protein
LQSGISGYNLGSSLENKYRSYQLAKVYRRSADVEYLQAQGIDFNPDGTLVYSNTNARNYYKAVFRNTFVAKETLTGIYADGRRFQVNGVWYSLDPIYGLYKSESGVSKVALGLTVTGTKNGFDKFADIYLSKASFSDLDKLHITLGHELNHVAIFHFGLPKSEAFCLNWSANAYMAIGRRDIMLDYMDMAGELIGQGSYFFQDFNIYFNKGSFGIPYPRSNF